jgi:hypothetical protein
VNNILHVIRDMLQNAAQDVEMEELEEVIGYFDKPGHKRFERVDGEWWMVDSFGTFLMSI